MGEYFLTAEQRYKMAERNSPSPHTRRCIDNKITGSGNCVALCEYEGHKGFLTRELRKQHDCIGKGCRYYNKKPKKEKRSQQTNRMAALMKAVW